MMERRSPPCRTIEINKREQPSESDLLPKLEPVDEILM